MHVLLFYLCIITYYCHDHRYDHFSGYCRELNVVFCVNFFLMHLFSHTDLQNHS